MGDCECKFGETKSSTQVDIKCIPPTPIPGITNLFPFPLLQVGGELTLPKKTQNWNFHVGTENCHCTSPEGPEHLEFSPILQK